MFFYKMHINSKFFLKLDLFLSLAGMNVTKCVYSVVLKHELIWRGVFRREYLQYTRRQAFQASPEEGENCSEESS